MQQKTDKPTFPPLADNLITIVRKLVDELQPDYQQHRTITLDSSLDRDLGLDSLTRVELLARIEQAFDISLPEQVIATAETPRDFLRAVLGAGGRSKETALTEAEIEKLARVEKIPESAETLVQVLQWHVANHSDRPHIRLYNTDGDDDIITYGELWLEAKRLAAGLQHLGLTPGESVLIMLPTGRDYFLSFFSILIAGGVPVPLYPPGRIKQIEEHLRRHKALADNSRARLMITMPEAKNFTRLMRGQVESLKQVVTVAELVEVSDLEQLRKPALGGNDTAFLQYTSGSTGMPKGVVLSHANLLANIRAMGRTIRVTSEDVFVSWLPLYHDMGLIGAWLGSLYYACPLVVMSPLSFIARPGRWLKVIHQYRGTLSAAPNFAYELCLKRIDDHDIKGLDLSSWRCAFNGAEAVSPATLEGFIDRFSSFGFRPGAMMPVYGLAESSVGLTFPPLDRAPKIDRIKRKPLMDSGLAVAAGPTEDNLLKFPSCGLPLPGHQVRIVDRAGRELPDRQEGRLQFKGPSSCSGYFRNPAQTGDLFHGQWLDSGDRSYIAGGEIYITGRNKDIIIRAGRNIYPEELEEAIGKINGVRKGNVAVFGSIDSDSATERLIILAETRKRKPEALETLRVAINTVVNDLSGTPPDQVVLAPPNAVLKTSSGKIRRAASREVYERGDIGRPQRAVWLQVVSFALAGILPGIRRQWLRLQTALYAVYCWLLFGLAAPVVWALVVLLPRESWRWGVVRGALRLIARLAALPIQVQGLDNLAGQEGPCVMVANHASYLDGMILVAGLDRIFSFVAKGELKNNIFAGLFLKRLGTEFVERFDQQKGIEDAHGLIDRCRAGRSLFFFAEGTFVRMPGLLPFRLGSFETAVAGGLPVIPIAIRGTRSILRADSWFPRRGAVSIVIGSPLQPEEMPGDNFTAALRLRDQVRAWILRHCREPDLAHERPPLLTGQRHEE